MALKESGVRLVAEGYQTYMRQMQSINKAHEQAFSAEPGKKAARGAKEGAKGLSRFAQELGGAANMAKLLAASVVAVKFKQFAQESAMVAARAETLGVVLGQVAKNAGYSSEQTEFAVASVKQMGITTSAATQSLIQMAQADLDWARATELARLAQDAAVIGNINSSEAFQRLITATQRGNTIMLRTLGLNVNFQNAYKKMAQQVGVATSALTNQQRAQARTNAVIDAGKSIAGSYEAAMGTVGKQMTSLPRLQEEVREKFGQIFKVLLQIRVEAETKFLKGISAVADGIKGWGEVAEAAKDGLDTLLESIGQTIDAVFKIQETETVWTRLGKVIHDIGGIFVFAAARAAAFAATVAETVRAMVAKIKGEFEGEIDFGMILEENFKRADASAKEMFPTLLTGWEELQKAQDDVNMDRNTDAIDRQTSSLKEQIAALENRADVLKRVESIHLRFEKDIARANKEYAKSIEEFNKQSAKREADLVKRFHERIQKLEQDAAKQELQMVQDAHRNRVQEERQRNMELEQERRRYQLSQMQSLRRFNLDQTRLAAEGDILGLIRLREDYAIQQQEAQENRNLELQEGREATDEQKRQEEEDLAVRLQRLRQQTEERRQELLEAHNRELTDLRLALVEQRAEIDIDHQERLASAREARDESIRDLGRALQEEGKLTKEGMTVIADEIGKVFGDDGAASALIEGWAARAESTIAMTTAAIAEQIAALNETIATIEETGLPPPEMFRGARGERMRRLGMREGGSGVVTGPATFEVEPGVTEAFSFVPLAQQSLNVNMSGGFDIRGGEGASAGMVDASLERMVDTFEDVLARLVSRRGR